MSLNYDIFSDEERNFDELINETISHEIYHIIQRNIYTPEQLKELGNTKVESNKVTS